MKDNENQRLDDLSFGKPEAGTARAQEGVAADARTVEGSRQGISNRPGDEEPDSGVNREPGEDLEGIDTVESDG